MEEDLFETIMHRNGEVIFEAHLVQEDIEREIAKVTDALRPSLLIVRAMLAEGFYSLTPEIGLLIRKIRPEAINRSLATVN